MDATQRKVTLANKGELTGTGYLSEFQLKEAGWNELPEEQKYGLADEHLVVTFPHCDGLKLALFSDEVVLV